MNEKLTIRPVASAGKRALGVKRRKTCNRCQARENLQPVPNALKLSTGIKRGIIEVDMQPVERAEKLTTSVKRGTVKCVICVKTVRSSYHWCWILIPTD